MTRALGAFRQNPRNQPRHLACCRAFCGHFRGGKNFSGRQRVPETMTSYEFTYVGPRPYVLRDIVASWCAGRECTLQVTPLLRGVRLQITGREEAVREAIRTVRQWIRSAS
jgi:hypothetical protein